MTKNYLRLTKWVKEGQNNYPTQRVIYSYNVHICRTYVDSIDFQRSQFRIYYKFNTCTLFETILIWVSVRDRPYYEKESTQKGNQIKLILWLLVLITHSASSTGLPNVWGDFGIVWGLFGNAPVSFGNNREKNKTEWQREAKRRFTALICISNLEANKVLSKY